MIYKEINFEGFVQEFKNYGREKQYSIGGLQAIYDFLIETEDDIELDVIAICCDFVEYSTVHEYNKDYDKDYDNYEDIDETLVIGIDDTSFVILTY